MVLKSLLIILYFAVSSFAITMAPTTFDLRSLSIFISQTCDKNILISKDVKNLNADYFFNKNISCPVLFDSFSKLIKSKGLTLTKFNYFYIISKKPFKEEIKKVKPNYSNIELTLNILEINNNKLYQKGFKALIKSNFSNDLNVKNLSKFTFASLFDFKFSGLLNFMADKGFITIVSSPKIIVSNNHKSILNVGDTVSMLVSSISNDKNPNGVVRNTYSQKDVGLTISVTPKILKNGLISLNVNFVDETLKSYDKGLITTSKRSINSSFNITNNHSVVIGGLTSNQDINNLTKVPLLGDIPIIKYLFSYESKNNIKKTLVIRIKVRLLK